MIKNSLRLSDIFCPLVEVIAKCFPERMGPYFSSPHASVASLKILYA